MKEQQIEEYHRQRKNTPVYTGFIKYFPDAVNAVARCSMAGNAQHNPTEKLHWDRSKSGDEMDALFRHLMEAGTMDVDGVLHSTKAAWRALANLQKELEQSGQAPMSEYNNMTLEESINYYKRKNENSN